LDGLNNIDGLNLTSVPDYAGNNHWLNVLRIDSRVSGENPEILMNRLGENGVMLRLVWTLNHLQKPYRNCQSHYIEQAKELVDNSLCLPSSINLADDKIEFILELLNG